MSAAAERVCHDAQVQKSTRRLSSLDGLRGVAAAVVLLHHCFLTVPALAAPYFPDDAPAPAHGSFAWWMSSTPLHLLWAGREAVIVFFVISGLVLPLTALRSARFSWVRYYPQRLARLYLPVFGAVALGYLLAALVDRHAHPTSLWIAGRPAHGTAAGAVRDLTLITGISGLISPLWSLVLEVVFSLLLPLYVLVAKRGRRGWWLLVIGAIAASALGAHSSSLLVTYLPVFAIGAVAAARFETLERIGSRVGALGWIAVTVVALLLIVTPWAFWPRLHDGAVTEVPVVAVGSSLLVFAATFAPGVRSALESGIGQWLGRVSFSLYLIHEPIVIATKVLLHGAPVWVPVVVAIAISLAAAEVFYRLVEHPAHLLARRIGRPPNKGARHRRQRLVV